MSAIADHTKPGHDFGSCIVGVEFDVPGSNGLEASIAAT